MRFVVVGWTSNVERPPHPALSPGYRGEGDESAAVTVAVAVEKREGI